VVHGVQDGIRGDTDMKMSIRIGEDVIKKAIEEYMAAKLSSSLKSPFGPMKITMVIHNSYSDQRDGNSSPGSAEADIEIPVG
jgi:hypothetical protein